MQSVSDVHVVPICIAQEPVVLDAAVIGPENLVAALALVKSDTVTPPRSLVVGNPAKVVRQLEPHQVTWRNDGHGEYQRLAREALTDFVATEPLAAVEPDRQRLRTDAVAVRLSGETARYRQDKIARQEGTA